MRALSNGLGKFLIVFAVTAMGAMLFAPLAVATPILGWAQSFAVLAHETVTNGHSDPNQPTRVYGNLGVSPGTSVTGFYPDGTVEGGSIHINDAVAQLAMVHAMAAYTTLAGLPATQDLTGQDLGGLTLTPGVYHFDSSAQLTGALTLDYLGNPDADFVFQIGSTLTTGSGASVNVLNGGPQSGLYWQVGSSATLGTDALFAGNILALSMVGLDPRARILCGRAFGLTDAVTLTDNLISNDNSAQDFGSGRSDFGSYGFSGGYVTPIPEPATLLLLGTGLIGLAASRKKFKKA